jgi:hypothetical protein
VHVRQIQLRENLCIHDGFGPFCKSLWAEIEEGRAAYSPITLIIYLFGGLVVVMLMLGQNMC